MIRISAAGLAVGAALGLSACGGASNEFVAKATASCVKEGQSQGSCACQAAALNGALTDKERKFFLTTLDMEASGNTDPTAAMKVLTDSGLTMADMMSMGQRLQPVMEKAQTECANK